MNATTLRFEDPPLARLLFGDPRLAWLWLPIRLFLGWEWLAHGLEKVGSPTWMETGEALRGFWAKAVVVPPPPARPPIVYDWYRDFIGTLLAGGHHTWFAKLVVFGEIAVGVALVLGAFTGIAAFFGGFMNWSFVMAGTASSNGLLFALATWLVLAWKNAGWIGLDRWLLPAVGTPWKPGRLLGGPDLDAEPRRAAAGR
jgi:thiosulfate dehydrogenase [quinone] large subunit